MRFVIFVSSIGLMAGLLWLVHNTKVGTTMRATAENQKVAGLMGSTSTRSSPSPSPSAPASVPSPASWWPRTTARAHYYMGFMLGLKAFTAAVMGGIGNLRGAMVGGLILGLVENVGLIFVRGDYKDIFTFVVLVLVLIFPSAGPDR